MWLVFWEIKRYVKYSNIVEEYKEIMFVGFYLSLKY